MRNPFAKKPQLKGDHYSGMSRGTDDHLLGQMIAGLFGSTSSSGVLVNDQTALRLGAVWACITLLSDSIATLPLNILKLDSDGDYVKDLDHPLNDILKSRPNIYMTPTDLKTSVVAHLCTKGIWYGKKETGIDGRVVAINPLNFNKMSQVIDRGVIKYRYENETIPADQLVIVRGFSVDGITPMSPIEYSREAIGLAVSAEKHGASFFKNGASPGLALEMEKSLTEPQREALTEKLKDKHEGSENAARTLILEAGLKAKALGIKNTDAQYIESRKMSVNDIARVFRVPPHMIGDLDRSTNNNIEHQGLDFVRYSLNPYFKRIEEWFEICLLTAPERSKYRIRFNPEALLRGDLNSRSVFSERLTRAGVMTANEARKIENLPPLPGGDVLMVQGQMTDISNITDGAQNAD